MNLLALLMFVSLTMVVFTSVDPRFFSIRQIKSALFRITIGTFFGFLFIFLYGLDFPGLNYLFILIGVGGFAHLLFSEKRAGKTSKASVSLNS